MKYTIVSIDDSRAEYKKVIRERVGLEEVTDIHFVNGSQEDVYSIADNYGFPRVDRFKYGEIGIWLSVVACWQWCIDNNEELVVFEDDAIPDKNFTEALEVAYRELPEDYDFMQLWVPENQRLDYTYNRSFDDLGGWESRGANLPARHSLHNIGAERVCTIYAGYGGVAYLYSPAGSSKMMEQVKCEGIYSPIDCYMPGLAWRGVVKGYALKPNWATLVKYDWAAKTTVQETPLMEER